MALQHRREAAVRPRFLLALTLSTVTAVAIGAPLTIQAMRANEIPTSSSAAGSAYADQSPSSRIPESLSSAQVSERSLEVEAEGPTQGGIGSQARAKGQSQTQKSEIEPDQGVTSETSVLSNATTMPEAPATTEAASTSVSAEPTQPETTPAPTSATTATTATTAAPSSSSTSSSATTISSTTSTTRPSTTTTSRPSTTTSATTPSSTVGASSSAVSGG